ncbi:hypothetical protein CEP54_016021 [Fusarium duplospermum]|uniref:C2H2-type domain-containing protein n=1 Tax=Fusarium duplospermum TaxID=1325734 RepID=A0A428NJ18_9HYPO|nr:hypothetical protein CEP54_016021 [Fusarium duplospermum]
MPMVECSVCLENFENEDAYRDHLQYHERRATELLQELQACLHHISAKPRLINAHSSPISRSPSTNQPVTHHSRTRFWKCPHPDCAKKSKRASFERRKDLVRHAEAHKECEEKCLFCEIPILRVRKYFTHYDKCPTRLEHQRAGILSMEKDNKMRERRRSLHGTTELWLNGMLDSAASNRASGQRPEVPSNVIEPGVMRRDVAHTNCHPRPSRDHGALRPSADPVQTDTTALNDPRATEPEANNVDGNAMMASQAVSALNDLLQGMGSGYTTTLPTIDLSAMADHSFLPRAPVVTSYTMDEPYYINSGYQSMELGV